MGKPLLSTYCGPGREGLNTQEEGGLDFAQAAHTPVGKGFLQSGSLGTKAWIFIEGGREVWHHIKMRLNLGSCTLRLLASLILISKRGLSLC